MTIAVAIRTGSAIVFAADSKLTTRGLSGFEEDGTPKWQEQTYDNATKVVHDRNECLMAMTAGYANIGRITATDFIMTTDFISYSRPEDQDQAIAELVTRMVEEKRQYWATTQVPENEWPGPTLILASPSPGRDPRAWSVNLNGPNAETKEILTSPQIRLQGSYDEVFALLYGYHPEVIEGLGKKLAIAEDQMWDALRNLNVLQPVDKLNLRSMPIQDAVELAVFLANIQVEMDRFLPGTPACGGPIDVMVLQMAPRPGILSFPGKQLHHPRQPA